ncbi:MAG: S-layer family protein [Cyanobacteriota bacterium]|nr:S-layer family protein [Cyanobacteriota bacterium]
MKTIGAIATSLIVSSLGWSQLASAQIVPDATLPMNSIVTPDGNLLTIDGGTAAGSNLFHSFQDFSLPTGYEAFFNNAVSLENVITRVTGENISNIDGLLRANGGANLFLLNPNGIAFGPNARLDIGGSFFVSSAAGLLFEDGSFYGVNPDAETTPLLTVSVPVGLQFAENPGAITHQSRASIEDSEVGLQVDPGRTLALVGGQVNVEGGLLRAPGGRVELGGVTQTSAIGLSPEGRLSFPEGVARADVALTNGANINVRAGGGGNIVINARNLEISGGSTVRAGINSGLGSTNSRAGDIEIQLTETMTVSNPGSFISNTILPDAIGTGGHIDINARSLSVTDGGQIYAGTFGRGDVGNIEIEVEEAIFLTGSNGTSSGIFNRVEKNAIGRGGNINLSASSLSATGGGAITANVEGRGDLGTIVLDIRDDAVFDGFDRDFFYTGIYNRVEENAVGNAGTIEVSTGSLSVTNGARITAGTDGIGNAGSIRIDADTIVLNGISAYDERFNLWPSSGIFSSVIEHGSGEGGDIQITTGTLQVTNGAVVIANTFNRGNGGSIRVCADRVDLAGVGDNGQPSGLITSTEPNSTGKGGEIFVEADRVRVSEGAVISSPTRNSEPGGIVTIEARVFEAIDGGQVIATTIGSGNAGDINISASERLVISGGDPVFANRPSSVGGDIVSNEGPASGVFVSTSAESTGIGGSLRLSTDRLRVREGGEVSVSALGLGGAGNLEVEASSIELNNGRFLAETSAGNFGNIELQASDIQLRNRSRITTNATGSATGGNVEIQTEALAALENSDISANARENFGGRVAIETRGIFGTQFRETPTPESDITATSALGTEFNGTIDINLTDVNPTSGLLDLPAEIIDPNDLVDERCQVGGSARSEFVNTGRGGQPPSPAEALTSSRGWVDPRVPNVTADVEPEGVRTQLVEATGWIVNDEGQVDLVAEVPTVMPDRSLSDSPHCGGEDE